MTAQMERFYSRIREVKTLEELKAIYADFRQAFTDDQITIEQYHALRMAFHNAKILRV